MKKIKLSLDGKHLGVVAVTDKPSLQTLKALAKALDKTCVSRITGSEARLNLELL